MSFQQQKSDLVFVVGRQRSGTTVFRDLLKRQGAFDCDEVFHGDLQHPLRFYRYVGQRARGNPGLIHPETHRKLFHDYIDFLRKESGGAPLVLDVKYFALNLIPAFGDVDGRAPFFFRYLKQSGAHRVHIIRKNKLRIFVSEEIAKVTNRWSAGRVEHLVTDKPKIRVDLTQVTSFIETLLVQDGRVSAQFDKIGQTHRLYYEDMFDADGAFSAQTLAVGSSCIERAISDKKPGNLKMNPEPLSELVENYDEIAVEFGKTKHAWMLEGYDHLAPNPIPKHLNCGPLAESQ